LLFFRPNQPTFAVVIPDTKNLLFLVNKNKATRGKRGKNSELFSITEDRSLKFKTIKIRPQYMIKMFLIKKTKKNP